MNLFDRLNAWMDRSEVSWVTLLTKFLPILVPIIPAIQTKNHVVTVLGYEAWQGWVAAAIVEFFGYASMYKMMQFAFKKAGFWMVTFAVVIYMFYLGVIIAFNVLPEIKAGKEPYIIWMNSLFALLSVPASALTAISAIHTQRSEEQRAQIERAEQIQREEAERRRAERKEANERRRAEQLRVNEHPNGEHPNTRTPERRTANARTSNIPQPANERKFKPFPNTEQGENRTRIEQTARELQANGIQPSVRNIQKGLRLQDFMAAHGRRPTPEEEQTLTGWSISTISEHLRREG